MSQKPLEEGRYVVSASEIEAMEGVQKTHFLNEGAKRANKSLGDLTGLTGLGFHIIEVAPGCESTEFHAHYHEDECTYILSGTATVRIGDDIHEVGPGDFIGYRAGGLAHTMTNTGSELLRCIVVGQRLTHDVCDYPEKGKRIFRNEGLPWTLVDYDALEHLGGSVGKK